MIEWPLVIIYHEFQNFYEIRFHFTLHLLLLKIYKLLHVLITGEVAKAGKCWDGVGEYVSQRNR